jgi:hypothetical protein
MKLHRFISACVAGMALMMVQALPAHQAEEATKPATKMEKKAKKAPKETTETTGKAATSATETMGKSSAMTPATETPKSKRARSTAGSAQRATTTVPESEIAAAKASGKVWVNTETGVYHKGGQWYGNTKKGKFMTEQEAIKAGYHASKEK